MALVYPKLDKNITFYIPFDAPFSALQDGIFGYSIQRWSLNSTGSVKVVPYRSNPVLRFQSEVEIVEASHQISFRKEGIHDNP